MKSGKFDKKNKPTKGFEAILRIHKCQIPESKYSKKLDNLGLEYWVKNEYIGDCVKDLEEGAKLYKNNKISSHLEKMCYNWK